MAWIEDLLLERMTSNKVAPRWDSIGHGFMLKRGYNTHPDTKSSKNFLIRLGYSDFDVFEYKTVLDIDRKEKCAIFKSIRMRFAEMNKNSYTLHPCNNICYCYGTLAVYAMQNLNAYPQ